jgi:4-amino-4-deoxy-L-arabinose transferase-like glycosyltransferase
MSIARDLVLIVLCTCFIALAASSRRPLLKNAEGRVALVAQEMLNDGDWVLPHLNGEIRKEKPPLSSWLVAITTLTLGTREVEAWHAYLPVALSGMLLALLIYIWLKRVSPHATAGDAAAPDDYWLPMAGALMLVATAGFIRQVRSAEMDMLLALCVACAFYGFYRYRTEGSVAALLGAYVALALSILTKGHVGLVLVLPALWLWLILERSRQALPLQGRSVLWHLLGIVLVCAIVLPWGIPFIERSGFSMADFHREGGAGRFREGTGHRELIKLFGQEYDNIFFYLYSLPGWMLPWSALLPLALWQTYDLPPDERSPLRRLCWLWLVWGVLLLSMLAAKQRHYSTPLMPAVAILTADAMLRWLAHFAPRKRAAARNALLGISVLTGLALLVGAALWVQEVPTDKMPALSIAGIALAVFVLAGIAARQKCHCFFLWWAGAVCAVMLQAITMEKYDGQHESPVRFCRLVRERLPRDARLYDYGVVMANNTWRAQILFCLQRKVERPSAPLPEWINSSRDYALVNEKSIRDVPIHAYEVLIREVDFMGHKNDVMLIRARSFDSPYQ